MVFPLLSELKLI